MSCAMLRRECFSEEEVHIAIRKGRPHQQSTNGFDQQEGIQKGDRTR